VVKAIDKTPKWGVRVDGNGLLVPLRNGNIIERAEKSRREASIRESIMRLDGEELVSLMQHTYSSPNDARVLNMFLERSGLRTDTDGSVYFARELEYQQSIARDVLYPGAIYNRIMGIDSSAGGGAERTTFSSYDFQGTAQIAHGNSNNVPYVNVTGKQYSYPIYTILLGYQFTFQMVRAAMFANKPLDSMLVTTTRTQVEQAIDQWAILGNAQYGLPGLLSIPGATALGASTVGVNTTWADKIAAGDVAAVQADLLAGVSTIINNSKGTQAPDTLVLPIEQYILIFGTPRSDNSDTTIGSYFLQNNPSIRKVYWSQWLTGAASGGKDVYCVFDGSRDRINTLIPMPYTQHAPQVLNLGYSVATETRFGGVACYYPNSVSYMIGI
jgi:hypothetical protein